MTAMLNSARRAMPWMRLGLLLLACLYFLYRGPYRTKDGFDGRDLSLFYVAARAWVVGGNPYDDRTLVDLAAGARVHIESVPSLNPPMTFVLLAPLAALSWPAAETASLVINLALVGATLAMVMAFARLHPRGQHGLLFLAFMLSMAPFHTSIALGQLTIVVTALIGAALWGTENEHPIVSGACIALAVALKPQMGLVFLAFFLLRGMWKALFSAVSVLGAIAIIGIARLAISRVDWLPTLAANLSRSGVNDPGLPTAFLRVNVQALLHLFLPSLSAISIDAVTYVTGVAALATLFLALRDRIDREAVLLLYSGCAVVSLLVFYNRIYSATLLVLPIAWAFSPLRPRRLRVIAIVVAGASAVFMVPGAAALAHMPFPAGLRWILDTQWWPYLLLHQPVALLVILLGLLAAAMHRSDVAALPAKDVSSFSHGHGSAAGPGASSLPQAIGASPARWDQMPR
jgi:hypothetical protein